MKAKQIETYLISNYGEIRHDSENMETAIRETAKEFNLNKKALFLLVVENKPFAGTHSYGFQTGYGREIINTFKNYYNN